MSKLSNLRDFAQQAAEAIASVIDIEVTIIDDELIRIVGTGGYRDKIGQVLPAGSVSHKIIEKGKMIYVDTPRKSPICTDCSLKNECDEYAELCYPIKFEGKTIANLGLIAFNEKQKRALIDNREFLIDFLDKMAVLISSKVSDYGKTAVITSLKNQLEAIIDNIDEGIIAAQEGAISYINAKACEYFAEDIGIGTRLEDVILDTAFIDNINNGQTYHQHIYTHGREKFAVNALSLGNKLTLDSADKNEEVVLLIIRKIKEIQNTEYSIRRKLFNKGHVAKWTFGDLVYKSQIFQQVIEEAKGYAVTDSTVLIIGASGTGKEMFAQSIHNASKRKKGPFVAINCAALPENLLESELFGYAPGAFTGASKDGKQGLFELAHKGTIFLDEIGDMHLYLQSRLLRVLEQKEVMRIGDERVIPVDVRIIAATNKNLQECVKRQEFRQDLYYRLNILRVSLPSLKAREEDIPILAEYFIKHFARKYSIKSFKLDQQIFTLLLQYEWPGNARELRALMERLVVLSSIKEISPSLIRKIIYENDTQQSQQETSLNLQLKLTGSFYNIEKQLINATLDYTQHDINKTSELLGLSKSTIWRRLNMSK